MSDKEERSALTNEEKLFDTETIIVLKHLRGYRCTEDTAEQLNALAVPYMSGEITREQWQIEIAKIRAYDPSYQITAESKNIGGPLTPATKIARSGKEEKIQFEISLVIEVPESAFAADDEAYQEITKNEVQIAVLSKLEALTMHPDWLVEQVLDQAYEPREKD
jgi:hypothetical protein